MVGVGRRDMLPALSGIKTVFPHQAGHFLKADVSSVGIAKFPAYPRAAIPTVMLCRYIKNKAYKLRIVCPPPLRLTTKSMAISLMAYRF